MPRKSQPKPFGENVGGMTRDQIQQFFLQQMQLFGPALAGLAQSATIQGARLEAGLNSQLARAGLGGSTGIGAMLRGVGGTYAAQAIQQEKLKAIMTAMTNSVGLSQGVLQSFTGIRQSEMAAGQGQAWDQRILGAIASLAGSGADIIRQLGKPGTTTDMPEPGLEPRNPNVNRG